MMKMMKMKSMTEMHEENFGEDEMQKQNDDHTQPAQSSKGDPEEEASGNTDGGGRDVEELEMHKGEKLRNRNIQEMHEEDAKMQNRNDDHIQSAQPSYGDPVENACVTMNYGGSGEDDQHEMQAVMCSDQLHLRGGKLILMMCNFRKMRQTKQVKRLGYGPNSIRAKAKTNRLVRKSLGRICLAGTKEEDSTSPRTVKAIGNGHCDRVEECLRLLEKLNISAISTSPSPKRISHPAARNTSIRTSTPRSIHETGTAIKKNIFEHQGDQISQA